MKALGASGAFTVANIVKSSSTSLVTVTVTVTVTAYHLPHRPAGAYLPSHDLPRYDGVGGRVNGPASSGVLKAGRAYNEPMLARILAEEKPSAGPPMARDIVDRGDAPFHQR